MNRVKRIFRRIFNIKYWGYGLFWSWNLIFLAFIFLGFAPNVVPDMIDAVREDLIPIKYLVTAVLVTLIPVMAVLLGLMPLRRSPGKLLALGYGVEGPLMVLLLVRIFAVRDSTPPIDLLYLFALLGVFTLLWQILDKRINERGLVFDIVRIVGLTLLFLVGIYAAVLIGFYVVPILKEIPQILMEAAREFWRVLTDFDRETLIVLPFTLLGIVLGLYTATLVIIAPIAVPILYVVNWWRGLQAVGLRRKRLLASLVTAGVGITAVLLFILANQQPQHKAYALLENQPKTLDEAKELQHEQEDIRRGLLNAYLAPVRYLSAVGEVMHVQEIYKWSFNLSDEAARKVEQVFEIPARPVLYEPMVPIDPEVADSDWWNQRALRSEPQEASRLYEAFFDETIFEGERETILNAVKDTWSGDQALLAWQAVDDREILLTQQDVRITEHGDWAEVELFEAYQNQTSQRQEVVYYFSLPETAVLTGVWLGDSPNRSERAAFRISPRGAAQQVYREQVRINIDPALLEQIGPRQYRLRVFPIEPQRVHWNGEREERIVTPGAQLYMWLTYTVLANDGDWPLPLLAEKANVYWDQSSLRTVNGNPLDGQAESWLPNSVAAAKPVESIAHQVSFPSGETVVLLPVSDAQNYEIPADLQLAVVLDRSRSMEIQSDAVAETLTALQTMASDVDVYLTSSFYRGEQASIVKLAKIVPNQIDYIGGQNAAELLDQFFDLSKGRSYDALFVLTDGTGFQLGGESVDLPIPNAPVWMVHLDGNFPYGYDDVTLQAIQASGGGVAGNLDEALLRLAVSLEGATHPEVSSRDIVDGYEWLALTSDAAFPLDAEIITHRVDDPFATLAARRLILNEMYQQRGQIEKLETLDYLHAVAKEHGIVTPYSSMIVLVNNGQQTRLDKLEAQENRFEREVEEIGETVPSPLEVTGVPEPHEWLLIFLSIVILGWYAWHKRMDFQQGRLRA
ncbi:MAG: TIGR02921 family PEP-CTERM protein [Anaerolineales bacterium]